MVNNQRAPWNSIIKGVILYLFEKECLLTQKKKWINLLSSWFKENGIRLEIYNNLSIEHALLFWKVFLWAGNIPYSAQGLLPHSPLGSVVPGTKPIFPCAKHEVQPFQLPFWPLNRFLTFTCEPKLVLVHGSASILHFMLDTVEHNSLAEFSMVLKCLQLLANLWIGLTQWWLKLELTHDHLSFTTAILCNFSVILTL